MQTARGQLAFSLTVAMAFAIGASGCAVGGKSFSIDSNSRIPFFGLELRERAPKSSSPSYSSISRSSIDNSHVAAAIGVGSVTSVDLLKKGDKRAMTARISRTLDSTAERDSRSRAASHSSLAESIALPRTDDHPSSPDRQVASSVINFE